MEGGKEVGFTGGDGMDGGAGVSGEVGGGGVNGVDVVPDGGGAHTTVSGKDPGQEEAISGGGSCGVFSGLFEGTCGDDGVGIGDGSGEVGG